MKNKIWNIQEIHPISSRLGWMLASVLVLWSVFAQGEEFRYRYVSLDHIELPLGVTSFSPAAINNSGRIYGTACYDDLCNDTRIAFYNNEVLTVSQSVGNASVVNSGGTVGGFVLIDPLNYVYQAALFRGDKVELIPPQPGEVFGFPITLNDRGTALVESDTDLSHSYALYRKGLATPLDFGPIITKPMFISYVGTGKFLNNDGIIAGTTGNSKFDGALGFRFDTKTGKTVVLEPLLTDTLAWGVGINNRGDVLGYSFVNSRPYHENIGVWDRNGHFKTYFTETISSSALVFNDNNLIVITLAPGNNSYLVTKPGVSLNLADLVENMPTGDTLRYIFDLNNNGDMLGFSGQGATFLLERLDANS